MPKYRAYLLKENHIYQPPHEFVAPDDAAAREVSQQLVDGHDVEVWQDPSGIGLKTKTSSLSVGG